MTANYLTTSADIAIARAKNYRGAKEGLQASIGYAVAQLLQGNADGLHVVMTAAGLIENRGGEMHANADGRAVFAYLTDPQGLGLKSVVRWDKESGRFKMAKGWENAADKLDLTRLVNMLANVRWDQFKSRKASEAFDLDKAVARLVKRAMDEGIEARKINAAVKRALAA
jgi:hypothetical protein